MSSSVGSLKGMGVKVLDDGFVQLVDVMGDDAAIVQAARVSYGAGTKTVSDDRGLIRYLMRHWHTTPFEMCELKFLVRVPMDTWRQWIRHRTANVNEYSTRYSEAIDSQQKTEPGQWRAQATDNKQGSGGAFLSEEIGRHLSAGEQMLHEISSGIYRARLEMGVAREQARKDLPLSTYTEAYWKIDLHNLFHFLRLRMDSHAQREIREYATAIGEQFVAPLFPLAWEAFCDYRLQAVSLSRVELQVVRALLASDVQLAERLYNELSARERKEFRGRFPELEWWVE
jgi:thymidylate synthase (FAD)